MSRIISRTIAYAFVAAMTAALASTSANAVGCLRDQKAFQLTGDSIEWSMAIAPGANCIQGLRWSYMQIYAVWVLKQPAHGELVMVGPGFRYRAEDGFVGDDKFSLVVVGKNRHEEGYSTVEITVTPKEAPPARSPAPDSAPAPELPAKVANAAPLR